MAGVNKVILVGNLGADPEARSLPSGSEVVNLRVATSENWKDKDGNRQERTEWHRVTIFNENLGRVAKNYLRKGSKVYLEGQLQTRKWTDQAGVEKFSTEITDHAHGDGMNVAERIADGAHPLPDPQVVGVAERRFGQGAVGPDPQQRHIDRRIGPDHLPPERPPVGHRHRDALGAVDDMVIRQDEAFAIDDESAARSLTRALEFTARGVLLLATARPALA